MNDLVFSIESESETPYTSTIDTLIDIEREILSLEHKLKSAREKYRDYLELYRLFKDDIEGFKQELMLILENNSALCSFHEKEEDHPVKNIKIEKTSYSIGDDKFRAGCNYIYTVTIEIAWPKMMINREYEVSKSLYHVFEYRIHQYFNSVNELRFILKEANNE